MEQKDWERRAQILIGGGVIFSCIGYAILVNFHEVPAGNHDLANFAEGALLGTAMGQVIGFYYGGSKSSKDKDDTMNKLAEKVPPPAGTLEEKTDQV